MQNVNALVKQSKTFYPAPVAALKVHVVIKKNNNEIVATNNESKQIPIKK